MNKKKILATLSSLVLVSLSLQDADLLHQKHQKLLMRLQ